MIKKVKEYAKQFTVGSKVIYTYDEFDGNGKIYGIITTQTDELIIMTDKDNITYCFSLDDDYICESLRLEDNKDEPCSI